MLLTPATFEINFCGGQGTSPRTSITAAASCQRALTTKAGGTNVRARYIHARMRTVCFDIGDGGSENRKTSGAVARRAWTGITRRPPLRNTVRRMLHVAKRSRRRSRILLRRHGKSTSAFYLLACRVREK